MLLDREVSASPRAPAASQEHDDQTHSRTGWTVREPCDDVGRARIGTRSGLARAAVAGSTGSGTRDGALRPHHRLRRSRDRSEEHTSELQSPCNLVCRLLLEKKKNTEHPSRRTKPQGQSP